MSDKELARAAKDYLSQIRKTDNLIKRLRDTVSALRSSLTGQNYELKTDKVQTSTPIDTMAGTVAKVVDLEQTINQRIDELIDLKSEAFHKIGDITDLDQQNVLIGRYIQSKNWEDLAVEFGWSTQWLLEVHGKALLAFTVTHTDFFESRVKQSKTE